VGGIARFASAASQGSQNDGKRGNGKNDTICTIYCYTLQPLLFKEPSEFLGTSDFVSKSYCTD
jgi:hypothetical protein